MFKNKVVSYAVAGILSVGIGGTGASIFATTSQDDENFQQTTNDGTELFPGNQIQEIQDELEAHSIPLPDEDVDKEEYLEKLDPTSKERLEEISNNLNPEKLSSDEALELRKQRATLTKQENSSDKLMDMDEEVKAQAKKVLEAVLNGNKTIDEAIAELTKLGVTLTDQEILDLQTQFNSENNTIAKDIYNKQKEGKITRDEAREEIMKQRISRPDHEEKDEER